MEARHNIDMKIWSKQPNRDPARGEAGTETEEEKENGTSAGTKHGTMKHQRLKKWSIRESRVKQQCNRGIPKEGGGGGFEETKAEFS
jgi:hypothetical protein